MRIHGALAHQSEAVVHVQIGACLREQLADPRNLVAILGQMAMDVSAGVFARELARACELLIGRSWCETRSNRVRQALAAVPPLDQLTSRLFSGRRRFRQVVRTV